MRRRNSCVSFKYALALVSFVLLGACGGGGGGDGGPSRPPESLTLSTSSMAFNAANLVTPSSQILSATLSTSATGTVYLRVVVSGAAVATVNNILITGPTSGQATVVPTTASLLGPGVHTGTITVTACTSDPNCTSGIIGTPQAVSVTYTISGVTVTPASLDYTLTSQSPNSDYTRTFTVRAYPDFSFSNIPTWLTLTPSTGSSGNTTVTATLTKAVVDEFDGGTISSNLTVAPTSGSARNIGLSLALQWPTLNYVAPYVVVAGQPGIVYLRGSQLTMLGANGIDFSPTATGPGIAPTQIGFMSTGTTVDVRYPALPAGNYFVRMHDSAGNILSRSRARLVVLDPRAFTASAIPYPADSRTRRVNAFAYDAERNALLVAITYPTAGAGANELLRYTYTTNWNTPSVTAYPYLDSFALSTDGKTIVATSSPPHTGPLSEQVFAQRDATTLAQGPTLTIAGASQGDIYADLVAVDTNEILGIQRSTCCSGSSSVVTRYSIKNNAATHLTTTSSSAPVPYSFAHGHLAAGGNGQRVFIGDEMPSSGSFSMWSYTSSAGTNALNSISSFGDMRIYALRFDRNGQRLLLHGRDQLGSTDFVRVYDPTGLVFGTLSNNAQQYALSPDGTRAYAYTSDAKIHIYDTTSISASTFTEIGTPIDLVASPGTVLFAGPQQMLVSPDGRTLFIAGSDRIIVQPLP